jgi:hypothetical protein
MFLSHNKKAAVGPHVCLFACMVHSEYTGMLDHHTSIMNLTDG